MISKWAQEEKRRRKAERATEITEHDREVLELMRQLRRHVGGNEFRENPRAVASHAVWCAIEK